MNPFQSLRDYEVFVYTLSQRHPSFLRSTLIVAQRGRRYAELSGEIAFVGGFRLTVYERLTLEAESLTIEGYSYEAWKGSDKLYWYDSQPHPSDPTLQSTYPHHKHVPPDIKHHRIPAPGISFDRPNLQFLVEELERLIG
jgi:hypothetical protein